MILIMSPQVINKNTVSTHSNVIRDFNDDDDDKDFLFLFLGLTEVIGGVVDSMFLRLF